MMSFFKQNTNMYRNSHLAAVSFDRVCIRRKLEEELAGGDYLHSFRARYVFNGYSGLGKLLSY